MKRAAVNRGDNAESNRLKRAFQAKAQEGRERYYNNIADDGEEALQRNDMKPIYKAVRHVSGKLSVGQGIFPRKTDGQMCKSEEEALLRWTEYYSTALNHPPAQPCPVTAYPQESHTVTIFRYSIVDAPTLGEVCVTIGKLKNDRSPGFDGITAELLKYSAPTTAQQLGETIRLGPAHWQSPCGMEGWNHSINLQRQGC